MRNINWSESVDFPSGKFTLRDLVLEIMGDPSWSQDEASAASFDRIAAVIRVNGRLEEKDHERLCTVFRTKNFPAGVALELGHLRNVFVLTPKEPDDLPVS